MKQHKLFYGSSYDRGLDILLDMWPKILEKFPDALLHCCYGWNLFDVGYADNPERMAWKKKQVEKMKQTGITEHGRLGKKELAAIRSACGIWAYPTYFPEINCITALDCQHDGLVPVTMDYAALSETVGSGVKVKGDIYDESVQKEWLEALYVIMGDEKTWKEESEKAQEFAKGYEWERIGGLWAKNF